MPSVLDIKNSVKNLINKNNTNTSSYDISDGLEERVKFITSANSAKQPVLNIDYPAIFVELKNYSGEHVELGMSARRNIEAQIDIVPVVHYGMGLEDASEESDDECALLVENIKELFNNNIKVSSTVDRCLVSGIEYDIDEGTYNSQARINLLINKRG